MDENTIKIRLKVGQTEVEYEGSESFLKNDLCDLLGEIGTSLPELGANQLVDTPADTVEPAGSARSTGSYNLSVETIASCTSAETAADLVLAASAFLTFVDRKTSFSRTEILTVMKGATAYYKESMPSNLSKTLAGLVRQQSLNKTASGTYAMSAKTKQQLEKQLAQRQ